MSDPIRGRLLSLHAGKPARNMAIDQALLESMANSETPVLRLYLWETPALSLGYFQSVDDRGQHLYSQSLECVRRSSGGGAIVHDQELTYSLTMPANQVESGARLDLYRQTHQAVIAVLQEFGIRATPFRETGESWKQSDPFLCFQRRTDEDLIVSGYKVLGSAQRKNKFGVLQHGSLLIRASEWAPELPGLTDLSSKIVSLPELCLQFSAELTKLLSVQWVTDELTSDELVRAREIERERYGSVAWLNKR